MIHLIRSITLKKIFNVLLSSIFVYMITVIDVVSCGTSIFTSDARNVTLVNLSMVLYLYGTAVSQIFLNIFTKIEKGVLGSLIFEVFVFSRAIYKNFSKGGDIGYSITNTLFCVSIGTLIFAGLSTLIQKTSLYDYCELLTVECLNGCFIFFSIIQFKTGYKLAVGSKTSLILAICLCAVIIYLEYRYPDVNSIITLCLILSISLFYVLALLISIFNSEIHTLKNRLDYLRDKNLLNPKVNPSFAPSFLLNQLDLKKLDFLEILKNSHWILSIGLFSLVFYPMEINTLSELSNLKCILRDEIAAQGYTNFISAIFLFPSYLLATDTYAYHKSGSVSKYVASFLGIALLSIGYFGSYIYHLIPKFIISAIPIYLGVTFLIPCIKNILDGTFYEGIVSIITGNCLVFINVPIFGILISFALSTMYSLYSFNFHKKIEKLNIPTNFPIRVISFKALTFLNLLQIKKEVRKSKYQIVINFKSCRYIDGLSRKYLIDIARNSNMYFYLLGKSMEGNVNEKMAGTNVRTFESEYELLNYLNN